MMSSIFADIYTKSIRIFSFAFLREIIWVLPAFPVSYIVLINIEKWHKQKDSEEYTLFTKNDNRLFIVIVALFVLFSIFQERLIFYPQRISDKEAEMLMKGIPVEPISLKTHDNLTIRVVS